MMKTLYKFITVLVACFIFVPAFAQTHTNPDDIYLDKWVSGPVEGKYTLTLEAYAKGKTVTTITEDIPSCDIALVMDLSSSMKSYVPMGEKLSSGTTLETGKTYYILIDGTGYALKCFSRTVSGKLRYYYRYKDGSDPTAYNNGSQLGEAYYSSLQQVTNTGTFSNIYSAAETRISILKNAAKGFVDAIYDNNPEKGDPHNIGLIGFHGDLVNYNSGNMQAANATNISDMKSWIDDLNYNTGTRSDLGMEKAYTLLNNAREDGRPKTVVFFTDGCPSTSGATSFNSAYAKAAVNIAYAMKQPSDNKIDYTVSIPTKGDNVYTEDHSLTCTYGLGAAVYSVAILSSESSSGTTLNIRRFLHYVSSNYNISIQDTDSSRYDFTSSYTDVAGNEAPHDYYQLSTGANLAEIFENIAKESSGTTSGKPRKLDDESTTVVDIVTSDFKLPENVKTTDIITYSVRVKSYNATTGEYSWYTKNDGPDNAHTGYTVSFDPNEENKVNVTGFDFTKDDVYNDPHTQITAYGNWVGSRTVGSTTTYAGEKLVIEIPIIVNQELYEGGYNTPTNTTGSSIIYEGTTGQADTVAWFPVPKLDFPSIAIAKYGLNDGESATFNVKRIKDAEGNTLSKPDNLYSVILPESNSNNKTFTHNGKDYTYVIIKDVPEGIYEVSESSWSWTYDIKTPSVQSFSCLVPDKYENIGTDATVWNITDNDGVTRQVVAFIFDDEKKDVTPAHGEDSIVNPMYIATAPGE